MPPNGAAGAFRKQHLENTPSIRLITVIVIREMIRARLSATASGNFPGKYLSLGWVLYLCIVGHLSRSSEAQADTHIYAGAVGTNQLDALLFNNESLFNPGSGYKMPMVLRTNGLNVGYFRGDSLTFTVLSATDLGTGQVKGRALLGSRLAIEIVSADGPSGGAVQFWEGDGENPGNRVTSSLAVGSTNGTFRFIISENDGSPGSDPYGHIHGREFTVNLPGLYRVGFRLVDVSTNGLGGGPLHSPSSVLPILFQAGPTIESLQRTNSQVRVYFRSAPGVTNVLEASETPATGPWLPLNSGLRGNSTLQVLVDTNSPSTSRFYRLHLLNLPP